MKLSYLVDLVSIKKGMGKLSDFDYVRYNYGPFDKKIYEYMKSLIKENKLAEGAELASSGDQFVTYYINEKTNISFNGITKEERQIADEVLASLQGYGTKALTDLTYRTRPMKKIGAKLGNKVGLNKPLNLNA